mgnify:CR=1 FL=1
MQLLVAPKSDPQEKHFKGPLELEEGLLDTGRDDWGLLVVVVSGSLLKGSSLGTEDLGLSGI